MISIVCPFYNEKENLKELYPRLKKVVEKFTEAWEMIFVDDGSTDGGADFLKSMCRTEKAVRLIELDRNYGLTTALYAGLQAAKGNIVATLDADLQNPPEEIPRLLALMEDADMVTGVRKRRRDPWIKKLSSKIANQIRRRVTGDTMEDVGCSLRVFRKEALRAFHPFRGMHRFFLTLAEAEGFRIKQIPVAHEPRRFGRSKYGLWNRILGPLQDLCAVRWMLRKKIRCGSREEGL